MRDGDRIDFPFEAITPRKVIEGCLFILMQEKSGILEGEVVSFSSNVQQISRGFGI